jgi:acetyl-CoA carboxylase biotin carboxyl carrier protein
VLTFEQIKELIELVSLNRLQGLELERSGFRLKIDGQQAAPAAPAAPMAAAPPVHAAAHAPAMTAASAPPPAAAPAPAPAAAAAAPAAAPAGHIVNSPIVGTFYRAASPDSPPFCEVGSRVKEGQVLCIIEAMKLMNEIEAKVAGRIVKVVVENGQPVEFGQSLFLMEPLR